VLLGPVAQNYAESNIPNMRPQCHFSAVASHNRALRIIGEHREQGGHRATRGRGQIESLVNDTIPRRDTAVPGVSKSGPRRIGPSGSSPIDYPYVYGFIKDAGLYDSQPQAALQMLLMVKGFQESETRNRPRCWQRWLAAIG
jgi:hypothetical protein